MTRRKFAPPVGSSCILLALCFGCSVRPEPTAAAQQDIECAASLIVAGAAAREQNDEVAVQKLQKKSAIFIGRASISTPNTLHVYTKYIADHKQDVEQLLDKAGQCQDRLTSYVGRG